MEMINEGAQVAAEEARRTMERAAAGAAAGEYLTFRVGDEHYGVEILQVQEIRSHEQPTRVAGAPESVTGVINLRGVVVPVVDLRTVLGSSAQLTTSTVVIVLSIADKVIGAVVDSVSDVVALAAESLQPAPAGMAGSEALKGIGTTGDRMLLLLDMQRLLARAGALPTA